MKCCCYWLCSWKAAGGKGRSCFNWRDGPGYLRQILLLAPGCNYPEKCPHGKMACWNLDTFLQKTFFFSHFPARTGQLSQKHCVFCHLYFPPVFSCTPLKFLGSPNRTGNLCCQMQRAKNRQKKSLILPPNSAIAGENIQPQAPVLVLLLLLLLFGQSWDTESHPTN